ncbi:pirin family protein [Geitlerinema sp. P-1104]|uniref:pirin family protein n=1 Tax=Geitlerinema sp. P-1104 TaxID=2546230 RepID=UPI001476C542|nr:pirin family protein [Geitlerinema sp. P-1104]NMG57107.1 pirin family protein [Geitlerinema sp. P-1104]
MFSLRAADDRGKVNLGWLNSRHSFSFGHYYDRNHMGFRSLRVINEDLIQPGQGFPTHGHRDMEIITYVLDGALAHKDSLGNGSTIRPGDVQRMSAGTGIQHSEFNPSDHEQVHLLQIWILPNQESVKPSYEQIYVSPEEKRGQLRCIASPSGDEGSVKLYQDAYIYATILEPGESVKHCLAGDRGVWIQVARGSVQVQEHTLQARDAIALWETPDLQLTGCNETAEVLLFDLA